MSTTWINLTEAYASENYAAGDWGQIGYTAPGVRSTSAKYKSNEFEYTGGLSSAKGTWAAKNLHKLDECAVPSSGTSWALEATVKGESDAAAGQVSIAKASTGNVAACTALTPSFDKLIK